MLLCAAVGMQFVAASSSNNNSTAWLARLSSTDVLQDLDIVAGTSLARGAPTLHLLEGAH